MIDLLWLTLYSYFANALRFDTLLIQLNDTWSFLRFFAIFFCGIEETGITFRICSLPCFYLKWCACEFFPGGHLQGKTSRHFSGFNTRVFPYFLEKRNYFRAANRGLSPRGFSRRERRPLLTGKFRACLLSTDLVNTETIFYLSVGEEW